MVASTGRSLDDVVGNRGWITGARDLEGADRISLEDLSALLAPLASGTVDKTAGASMFRAAALVRDHATRSAGVLRLVPALSGCG
jgi:hypothetical protein